jgi:hypothetical protein
MRLPSFRTRLDLVAGIALSLGCAATQPVRVLRQGEIRWIGSVGGPLLPDHVPTKVIPYANAGVMWGHRDNLTLSANAHLLSAAFGIAGFDVGAARRLYPQTGLVPEVTGQAQLYLFAGTGGWRAYPHLTGTTSWSAGSATLLYGGSAVTVRPSGGTTLIVTPHVGVQQDIGPRLALQLEGKWMAANIDSRVGIFEGEGNIAGRGGRAIQLGIQVKR